MNGAAFLSSCSRHVLRAGWFVCATRFLVVVGECGDIRLRLFGVRMYVVMAQEVME